MLLQSEIAASETDMEGPSQANDQLIISDDPHHPANHICTLCRNFYNLGWVTGTGGGTSIRKGPHIFIAPSGVQKELMQPENIFVLDYATKSYLRKPPVLKPSACTPLFMAAFERGAGCCIQSVATHLLHARLELLHNDQYTFTVGSPSHPTRRAGCRPDRREARR